MSENWFDVPMPLPDFLPEAPADRTVHEPAKEVPVIAEADVAVFGGGPAGTCAAAAAARCGAKVVLIERHGCLGGMATVANVNIWHQLYGLDKKTKIIGGIPEAILRRLQADGAAVNYDSDGETGPWRIHSETAKLAFDDLVIASGARLLFHTWLADVVREGDRISAALVEGKSGRGAVVAKTFIDATGDADLIRRAGLKTQLGGPGRGCQPPTLCFRIGGRGENPMDGRRVQAELFKHKMPYNGEPYPTFLWTSPGLLDPREVMFAGVRVLHVDVSDTRDFTRAEVEGRYQMRWVLAMLKEMPGWSDSYLIDIGAQIGVRESHRIVAEHALSRDEVLHGASFPDTIAQGSYPIDIHHPNGPGLTFEYLDGRRRTIHGDATVTEERWDGAGADSPLRETNCYQVPYRSLIPRGLTNVLAAGRCIGASHESAGAIRVMINAMQFGQAAGVAAAMADRDVRAVETRELRQTLREWGQPLPD